MDTESKNKILKYINDEFLKDEKHYSYCQFPEQECTCRRDGIDFDTDLIRNGYLDSFDMVSVLVFVEIVFRVRIPDREATAENFASVNKIAELIDRHV